MQSHVSLVSWNRDIYKGSRVAFGMACSAVYTIEFDFYWLLSIEKKGPLMILKTMYGVDNQNLIILSCEFAIVGYAIIISNINC